ncbi:MAG: hypothetical protein LBL97_09130 [Prevotellaceae bacterium]|jgi:predicted tellurium resistance membrane protein TerC|nr:hypothetical protein [Prevotellaceae bacterium]
MEEFALTSYFLVLLTGMCLSLIGIPLYKGINAGVKTGSFHLERAEFVSGCVGAILFFVAIALLYDKRMDLSLVPTVKAGMETIFALGILLGALVCSLIFKYFRNGATSVHHENY